MRQVSFDELLNEFVGAHDADEVHDTRAALERTVKQTDATALVLFENVQMDSSAVGEKTVMAVGLGCTYMSVDDIEGKHLHDLPSQRQYPQVWCSVEHGIPPKDATELAETITEPLLGVED